MEKNKDKEIDNSNDKKNIENIEKVKSDNKKKDNIDDKKNVPLHEDINHISSSIASHYSARMGIYYKKYIKYKYKYIELKKLLKI